jgi:Ca2+/Na+ antiporter
MDEIIKFFNLNISHMIMVLLGIYMFFYIIKIDILLITTLIVFVIYFYYKYQTNVKETNIILHQKTNEKFKNEMPSVLNKHDDIINFLYFINDFKQYNPDVYNELIININDFLTLYKDYQIIREEKKKLMQDVIFDTKAKILDNLSSFIYSFNNSPDLRLKLNNSIDKLNDLLNLYINKLNINIDHINAFNDY